MPRRMGELCAVERQKTVVRSIKQNTRAGLAANPEKTPNKKGKTLRKGTRKPR